MASMFTTHETVLLYNHSYSTSNTSLEGKKTWFSFLTHPKKKNPQSRHVPLAFYGLFFFLSFWALPGKITFVSRQILSQNIYFVMISLIISACTKTRNSKTKRPKRNKRNDCRKCRFHLRYSLAFIVFNYDGCLTKLNFLPPREQLKVKFDIYM